MSLMWIPVTGSSLDKRFDLLGRYEFSVRFVQTRTVGRLIITRVKQPETI